MSTFFDWPEWVWTLVAVCIALIGLLALLRYYRLKHPEWWWRPQAMHLRAWLALVAPHHAASRWIFVVVVQQQQRKASKRITSIAGRMGGAA